MAELEKKFKELEKHLPFMKRAVEESVTYITDREKKTLKGIQKIIECRKFTALDKLGKCDKFIARCVGKEKAHLLPPPAATTASAPTMATVVILSSDDEDCAIVDSRIKKTEVSSSKTFKPPSPKKETVPNITNMEILSLIDELSLKKEEKKEEKSVDNGISLISSEESDSWNTGAHDEESRERRKARKLKKKEKRKLEKLKALKEKLNSKDKNIESLMKKLGYCSDSSLSSVESSNAKKKDKKYSKEDSKKESSNKDRKPEESSKKEKKEKDRESSNSKNKEKEGDASNLKNKEKEGESSNKERKEESSKDEGKIEESLKKEEVTKNDKESSKKEEVPKKDKESSTSEENLITEEIKKTEISPVPSTSKSYVKEPLLIIKDEVEDDYSMMFTRRPKREFSEETKTEVLPVIENSPLPEPVKEPTDMYQQLRHLLYTEVGVNMDDFLDIMKTDKFEIKKEIITKVLASAEDPPPAPRFPKPIAEDIPPPPRFKKLPADEIPPPPPRFQKVLTDDLRPAPRDPRIPQEINLNVNLNMPTTDMFNDHTLNLNIRTSNGMQLNSTQNIPQQNIRAPILHKIPPLMEKIIPPPPELQQKIPPRLPSPPPLRDPRLRRDPRLQAQPNPVLNSPTSPSPILNSPEYSHRDFIPKPVQNKADFDKRAALTYKEYKKRKALEEQRIKDQQLRMLLNEVENKSAEAVRQLNERHPILEEKTNWSAPKPVPEVEKTVEKIVDKGPTNSKPIIQSVQVISKPIIETPVIEYVKPGGEDNESTNDDEEKRNDEEDEDEDDGSDMDEITKLNTLRNRELAESLKLKEASPTEEQVSEPEEENEETVPEKDVESEKVIKSYKKNFREVIRLNLDIMQSFMPNDVLQDAYGLQRSTTDLTVEQPDPDYVPKRIMTRRKSCSAARQEDPSPPKLRKRRKSAYVEKKETKKKAPKKKDEPKKNETPKTKTAKSKDVKDKENIPKTPVETDNSWQVDQKSPAEKDKQPKINLIIRKRAQSCCQIFSTSVVARPGFLKQLKKPVKEVVEPPTTTTTIPEPELPTGTKQLVIKLQRLSNEEISKYKRKNPEPASNVAKKPKLNPKTKPPEEPVITPVAAPGPEKIPKNTNTNHTFEDLLKKDYTCQICVKKQDDPVDHYISYHCTECYGSRLLFDQLINFTPAEVEPLIDAKGKKKIKYECFVCTQVITSSLVGIIYHISSHTGEYSFRCEECDLEKPFKKNIQKHIEDAKAAAKKKRGPKKKNEPLGCKDSKPIHYYRYPDNENELKCYYCKLCYFFQINKANIIKHVKDQHERVYNREDCVDERLILKFKEEGTNQERGEATMDIDETCDSTTMSACSEVPPAIENEPGTTADITIKTEMIEVENQSLQNEPVKVPEIPVKQEVLEVDLPDKENDLIPQNTIINSKIIRIFALFKCMDEGCNFATNLPDEFTKHMDSKNKRNELFNCCYCTKAVKGQFTKVLTDHIKNRHGLCRYQCNECFYRSFNLSNIMVHKRSAHALKGNLDVLDCLNALPDESAQMLRNKDKKNVQQMCKCVVCPPPLMKLSTDEMEKHIFQSHPLVSREKMSDNYYCLFCKYCCKEKYDMKQHMSTEHPVNFLKAAKIVDSAKKQGGPNNLWVFVRLSDYYTKSSLL
ncbi:hypothetical protein ACFFRR_002355 [Megaselia abdita]